MKPLWLRFSSRFRYDWWIYLIVTFLVFVTWASIFRDIDTPNPEEQLIIFVGSPEIDSSLLLESLNSGLTETDFAAIETVEVTAMQPGSPQFFDMLATRALSGTDLIILSSSAVFPNTGSTYFSAFDSTWATSVFGEGVQIYEEEGIAYGIILNPSTDSENRFGTTMGSKTEEQIVFFNAFSPNLGSMNDVNNSTNDGAIQAIIWLLGKQ